MSNEHNPPAFPVSVPGHTYGDGSSEIPYVAQEGMTIRDYFAGKAMQGIIANEGWASAPENIEKDAQRAYQYADAMLQARKVKGAYPDEE